MDKLISTLILSLSLSGAALADGGYFADHQGDFSNAPVSAGQAYDGVALEWSHRVVPVPTSNAAGVVSNDESKLWFYNAG